MDEYRCRQCGKPIFDEAAAMRHMERMEGHAVDALLPALTNHTDRSQ